MGFFIRRARGERQARTRSSASLPRPSSKARQGAHQMCHFTKRTHFIFEEFFFYRIHGQQLMTFAESFANGFVLEKRTHFGDVLVGASLRLRETNPLWSDVRILMASGRLAPQIRTLPIPNHFASREMALVRGRSVARASRRSVFQSKVPKPARARERSVSRGNSTTTSGVSPLSWRICFEGRM